MKKNMNSRRTFLQAIPSLIGAQIVAGCSSDGSGNAATQTPSPAPEQPTATDTPSPTATDSPTPTATDSPTPTATDAPTPTPGATMTPTPTGTASKFEDWFANVKNYDGIVDNTAQSAVTVIVGAPDVPGGPFTFEPAAINIQTGTTVRWKWTGRGGSHNVVDQGGAFTSELYSSSGVHFSYTFETVGTYLYFCRPHKSLGMKGAVVVEE